MHFILVIIILFSCFFATPAKATFFAQKPHWIVKEIILDDGLPPYCSMRRYYSEANVSLVLSQDVENNISLAIDFAEPILVEGSQYKTHLEIPEKLRKNITSNAVNTSTLVMQIGDGSSFLDGMRRGEALKVSMQGVNLQFTLSGTIKSLKKLKNCINNLNYIPSAKISPTIDSRNTFVKVKKEVIDIKPPSVLPAEKTKSELENILKSALNISDMDISNKEQGIYSWKKDDLFGNAQIFTWPEKQSFNDMMAHYIQKTKNRCTGSFASNSGQSLSLSGGYTYAVGDVACIGDDTDNAASLLFHGTENKFIVIGHEGSTAQLSKALIIRDQISEYFLANKK